MNEDIESLFQVIGHEASAIASPASKKLLIYAEVESNAISADLFYEGSLGGAVIYKHCPAPLCNLIYSLWKKWKSHPGNEEWRAMTYLVENGEFSVDFLYPDQMRADEDVPERRPKVIERHFGNAKVDYSTP